MARLGPHRLILLVVFAVSRLIYFAAGIRFDTRPLETFFQIFDPVLLENRLFETLLYAHTQPPGFNLILGCVLKLFPVDYPLALHAIYLVLGVIIMLTLFELMRVMGVSATLSTIATALFMVSPGIILFENLLMYEYWMLALLGLAAWCWWRFFTAPSALLGFLLFGILAALISIRSLFHLFYLVLIIAIAVYVFRGGRRKLLAAAALPLLLVFGIYFKNWVLYRQFTATTWMGFNIYTITIHQLTPAERERFIAEGKLSPVENIDVLGRIGDYSRYITPVPPRGVPVLDQEVDSTGRTNFNNPAFFQLHRIYLQDGKYLLLHYPVAYMRSIVRAWFAYFLPSSDFISLKDNRDHIQRFDRWFNIVAFGQFKQTDNRKDLRAMEAKGAAWLLPLYTGTFLIVALPGLFVFGCWKLWKGIRAGSWRDPANALLAFMLFHIAMITVLVNMLSSFENNRYRLPIDGFFMILAAMAVNSLAWKPRRRRQ